VNREWLSNKWKLTITSGLTHDSRITIHVSRLTFLPIIGYLLFLNGSADLHIQNNK